MPSPKYTKTVARRRMPSLLEYANRSCPLPKTCQRPKFLPHIWLVCGNWNTYRILNTYIVMQIDWNFSNFSSSNIRYEEIRFFHKVSFKKPAWSAWNKDSRPPIQFHTWEFSIDGFLMKCVLIFDCCSAFSSHYYEHLKFSFQLLAKFGEWVWIFLNTENLFYALGDIHVYAHTFVVRNYFKIFG